MGFFSGAEDAKKVELSYAIRRLDKLCQQCGGAPKKKGEGDDPPVDTSRMSEFQKGQYYMAALMQKIRSNIEKLDEIENTGASAAQKAEVSNTIRKDIAQLKKDALTVKKAAQADNKRAEYETLIAHKTKTEQLFAARFVQDQSTRDNIMGAALGKGKQSQDLSTLMDKNNTEMRPMVSVRDDEEFQLFFQNTKQNDRLIDEAVDRIGQGVTRLHENALQIQSELKVQKVLLEETEDKVDRINDQLITLNSKLKKTIESVDKDKMLMYLICCIVLLGVLGFAASQTGLIKM
eukprot:PhM_4_TR17330/c0_g1_i1/m.88001